MLNTQGGEGGRSLNDYKSYRDRENDNVSQLVVWGD